MPIKAVLFDLDGTLVHSIPDLAEAVRRMLAELGEPNLTEEQIASFVGKGIANLVMRSLTVSNGERAQADLDNAVTVFRRHYAMVNGAVSQVYPGVVQTLAVLRQRGMRMACITNKATEFTEPLLAKMGLSQYFDCVVSGDTLPQKKPAPEPLLHACQQLGVQPADGLMVGDSINDAQAAQAAGIPIVLVTYGYSEGQPVDTIKCDRLVSSFAELLGFLEESPDAG